MAVMISNILAGISIIFLIIYGIDVAVAQGDGNGFLPFDHKTRGIGLGVPSIILPIVAFFISRKNPSKTLGGLVIFAGILIIIGGITVLELSDPIEAQAEGRNIITEAGPLLGIGAFITILGIIKLKKS